MKIIILGLFAVFSFHLVAHEGHGDVPTDPSKYGGQLGSIVDEVKVEKKIKDNPPLFKGELLRSENGSVRLYVFSNDMKPIDMASLADQASGKIVNTKNKISLNFSLEKKADHYLGKLPKISKRPFDLFISLRKGPQKLFIGFDNLD